jgi:hypothetical protein
MTKLFSSALAASSNKALQSDKVPRALLGADTKRYESLEI